MAAQSLRFEDLSKELCVTVQHRQAVFDDEPITDIRVEAVPPVSLDEHIELLERVGPDSDLGSELVAGNETNGVLTLYMDGEPGEYQVSVGESLAKEIALLRGLAGAAFIDFRGETPVERVVLSNS